MGDSCNLVVNVCSGRNIVFRDKAKINILVQCTVGKRREKTIVAKNCGPSPMWNQRFSFKVKRSEVHSMYIEVKHRERFNQFTVGVAHVSLPEDIGEPVDSWVSLKKEKTQAITKAAIHIIYQLEARHSSNSSRIAGLLGSGSKSSLGSGSKAGKVILNRPLPSPQAPPKTSPPSAIQPHQGTSTALSNQLSLSGLGNFDGHVAAGFLNDIISSLEEVKSTIDTTSNPAGPSSQERITLLKHARKVLSGVEQQMKTPHEALSETWIENLSTLIRKYREQLSTLYETYAWMNVSMRIAGMPVTNGVRKPSFNERLRRLSQEKLKHGKPVPPPRPPRKSSVSSLTSTESALDSPRDPGPAISAGNLHVLEVPRSKARKHSLVTLEEFDSLVDTGMAVRMKGEPKTKSRKIDLGDTVRLEYEAFIWDPTTSTAVEYSNSLDNGLLEFIVGNEDVPQGLENAVQGLVEGSTFVCTLAPSKAFGDEGSDDGVPPNSHVVFDAKVVSVSLPKERKHLRNHSDMQMDLPPPKPPPRPHEEDLIYPQNVRASVHLANIGALPKEESVEEMLKSISPLSSPRIRPGRSRTNSSATSLDSEFSLQRIEEDSSSSDEEAESELDSEHGTNSSIDPFSDVESASFVFTADNPNVFGGPDSGDDTEGPRPPAYSHIDPKSVPPPPPALPTPPPLPSRPLHKRTGSNVSNTRPQPPPGSPSKLKHHKVKSLHKKPESSASVVPSMDQDQLEGLVGELKRLAGTGEPSNSGIGKPSNAGNGRKESVHSDAPAPPSGHPNVGHTHGDDVVDWLQDIGLPQYAAGFKMLGVDVVDDFEMLEAGDLVELKMKPIHKRKLLLRLGELGIDSSNLK